MRISASDIPGMTVTIMGLGVHGGGLASARFFAERGATVTVTDLRDETTLAPSIRRLQDLPVRYVLGTHETNDFSGADLVIKNPAVPPTSPFLRYARRIETDVSVFLSLVNVSLIAITGTKGKSTTASAVHHLLRRRFPEAKLGGNITVSPLSFIDTYLAGDPAKHGSVVVLELSSWQLADLKASPAFRPAIGVVTNIMPDHQNRYPDMQSYRADKHVMIENQDASGYAILNGDDPVVSTWARDTHARSLFVSEHPPAQARTGAWLSPGDPGTPGFTNIDGPMELLLDTVKPPGRHTRLNVLTAGLCARAFCLPSAEVVEGAATFPGIPHRLEHVATVGGVSFFNDSAATIPQATLSAVRSFPEGVRLVAGGTDKDLNFGEFSHLAEHVRGIWLLSGSATQKMMDVFNRNGVTYHGPYQDLAAAVSEAATDARPGEVVLFSPGCASFELFENEFDRGRVFKSIVAGLRGFPPARNDDA